MDQDDKRRLQERLQRAMKKHRGFLEEKRLREEARARKATRRKPSRARRTAGEDEDPGDDEPVKRRGALPRPAVVAATPGRDEATTRLEPATVVSLSRARVELETEDDAGRSTERLSAARPPGVGLAVGDRVGFERRAGGLVLVRSVEPRTSWLARPDPARPEQRLVLAANVELVLCVVAARAPRWKPGFVDRVQLAAEEGHARVWLVLNKVDLLAPEERADLERELAPFHEIVGGVTRASAVTGEGLDALREATAGRVCVFVGPSGVGKSSLLNALEPEALDPEKARATGAVRASDGKGRHTTTASSLTRLANGARLIDTPGVRQFALAGLDPRALAESFPELRTLATGCRFRDCTHRVEPDCAVRAALEAGRLPRRRFESYLRIRASLEAPGGSD